MSKKISPIPATQSAAFGAGEKKVFGSSSSSSSFTRSQPTAGSGKPAGSNSMHTVPLFSPSTPISQSDLSSSSNNNNQDSTTAVSTADVVKAVTTTEDSGPAESSSRTNTLSSSMEAPHKAVVTPDGKSTAAAPAEHSSSSSAEHDPSIAAVVEEEEEDDDDDDASISAPVSPPLTPHRVTQQRPGSVEHPEFSPPKGFLTVITTTPMPGNRNRILSLDRASMAGMDSFTANTASLMAEQSQNSNSSNEDDDDDNDSSHGDLSDGESSYFAKHLPSPKSGRRFSYSSNHSAPARSSSDQKKDKSSFYNQSGSANNINNNSNHDSTIKPSDASLSFSDESDDDDLPHSESPEPVAQLPSQVADMQLQTITRVHSVSSLVSSGSECSSQSHPTTGVLSPDSSLSRDSGANSTSDPSVNAELSTVVASSKNNKTARHGGTPSGRRSPLPANAAFMQHYYNTSPAAFAAAQQQGPHSSPPTIMPGYNVAGPVYAGMLHPQPQMMTPEQLSSWMGAPGNIAQVQQHQQQQRMFGGGSKSVKSSDGALAFVYSDDDETDDPLMNQLAAGNSGGPPGADAAAYNTFANTGGGHGGGQLVGGAPTGGSGNFGMSHGGYQQPGGQGPYAYQQSSGIMAKGASGGDSSGDISEDEEDDDFKVYWQRWVMLFYMSLLNLLSDWTCYSIAPIAILTQQTFGEIDPERLVVIFLGANAISTACEPIILARLGLKKTVLFGALLLMIGSMIKSGGIPPIIESQLVRGEDEWRLTLGFLLVGLSQPLYQCTPALLSASWFPERERTMATGVALNANQLGIGCAFVFGTLLVATSDDIPSYFGLLSMLSTLAFLGTLFFFEDAPPTPPSSSAKVMKGDLNVPDMGSIVQSVRKMSSSIRDIGAATEDIKAAVTSKNKDAKGNARRRSKGVAPAPSPAMWGSTKDVLAASMFQAQAAAPSPMMPGPVQPNGRNGNESPLYAEGGAPNADMLQDGPPGGYHMQPGMPYGAYPPQAYPHPYFDPSMQHAYYQQQPQFYPPPPHPYYYGGYQNAPPAGMYPPPSYPGTYGYDEGEWDDGAEPVITLTDHHLDIHIRDDQVLLSIRTCMARPGFIHCLVSFTISGIVINTLSTYMDYLVTLNGSGREMVGIVGGSFQGIIMISSLIVGSQTDKTRAYYSVIICMLVLGAFGLAQCGVSLDADRGGDLRWSLLIVAALVGPLQPVSTELGVEVAYPLSENTVLVIQQLFSNLLSALFIPFFKSLKDIGIGTGQSSEMEEKPQYTFSFYLLIVLHAGATVFFATFRGRYLRYEHELEKVEKKKQKKFNKSSAAAAFHPVQNYSEPYNDIADGADGERQPLTSAVH